MEYPVENRKRQRLSVGVGLFLTCLVLTAVVGLFAGLMISNYTHNQYVMYAEKAETPIQQREALRESAATAVPAGDAQTEVKAGTVASFSENNQFSKAQIVEMSAPSVVGIDTITTATTNSFWYGYGQSYEIPGSGPRPPPSASGWRSAAPAEAW